MDLTQLSNEELQSMFDMGSFAAGQELANRRNAGNTMRDMTPLERENMREAIRRNLVTDTQGDIRTFDIPKQEQDDTDLMQYSDSELMESDTSSPGGILKLLTEGGSKVLDFIGRGGIIGNVVDSIGDMFQYRGADPSITSTPLAQYAFRNELAKDPSFDIGAALDKQNALGGYYSDFARTQRQLAGRFSNLLDRARSGKTFSERNLLGISRALGTPLTRDDISNIESGAYNLNTGDGPSGAGTFTAESLSRGFDSEEGPVGGGTGTMSASDFSDDTAGTPF